MKRHLIILLLLLSLSRIAECRTNDFRSSDKPYVYAGLPEGHYTLRVLTNTSYLVGYDEDLKAPRWVAYRLFRIGEPWSRIKAPPRQRFATDKRTRAKVTNAQFIGIGRGVGRDRTTHARGHMAPNAGIANAYGVAAQKETFLLSNIAIQKQAVNAGSWEDLEDWEARAYANQYTNVWVICGPVFARNPPRWDKGGTYKPSIAVPKAFFKIHIIEQGGKPVIQAVVMGQQLKDTKLNLAKVQTTVKKIEKDTGLDFLTELPDSLEVLCETNKVAIVLPPRPKK